MFSCFPHLEETGHRLTSPETPEYNCIAWAASEDDVWWWPDKQETAYWPPNVPREETIDAFVEAYGVLGYSVCENDQLEHGFEKIAIYAIDDTPTHAARQLESGKWTSKLGKSYDIEHDLVVGVTGPTYGKCVVVMRRGKLP